MKSIINMRVCKRRLSLIACYLIAFSGSHAQQVSPTQNTFVADPTHPTTAVPYPGVHNLTSSNGLYNFITTITPDVPLQTLSGSYPCRVSTDYFDGLGRLLQTVGQKAYAGGNDIVQTHVYDSLGNETYQYLPFAAPTSNYNIFGNPAGKIKLNDSTELRGFYDHNGPDEQPYNQTVFESSPLHRVIKQMAPGTSWVGAGKGVTYDYKTNSNWVYQTQLNYYILFGGYPHWTIANTAGALPVTADNYANGQLYLTVTTDEDGKSNIEAKDKQGRVVMTMASKSVSYNGQMRPSDYAYTFYVYDDIGKLRCVIPPAVTPTPDATGGVTWSLSQDQMNGLCYTYFYDERGRPVEKKIPGKDVESFVYDLRDRLVMYQDGNMRSGIPQTWMVTIYDGLDRPTCKYLYSGGNQSRTYLQGLVNDNSTWTPTDGLYYVKNYNLNNYYPTNISGATFLSYNYYDDYSHLTQFNYDDGQFSTITPSANGSYTFPVKSTITNGLLTGSSVRIMDPANPGANNWLSSANFYDEKGRIIQIQSKNIEGGTDYSSNVYYFQGQVYKNITSTENPNAQGTLGTTTGPEQVVKIEKTFNRNFGTSGGNDLVSSITEQIDGGLVYPFANYTYDHLNRNVVKQTPAADFLNEYTMHGSLNHIQVQNFNNASAVPAADPQIFEEWLYYDKGFASQFLNGNIAGIKWTMQGANAPQQTYGYSYDSLNRLTHAEYNLNEGTLASPSWSNTHTDYTASNIAYDLNGNIQTMNQRGMEATNPSGPIDMDILNYTYKPNSNQLQAVEDGSLPSATPSLPDFKNNVSQSSEYNYDNNGNMTADANKADVIIYNMFNKPDQITVTGKGIITYVHDGAGKLLQKKIHPLNGDPDEKWDYIENFVYKNDSLQYILNEEGRARPVAAASGSDYVTKYIYDYFAKDHLGNVRSTITAQPINASYLASYEIAQANIEQLVFENVAPVRSSKPGSTDPDDVMAARLNGNDPSTTIGTSIMLKVMPGDRFSIGVDAVYDGDYTQSNELTGRSVAAALMSTLTGGINYDGVATADIPDNVKTIQTIFNNPNLASQLDNLTASTNDVNAPKAHLNYLFFDSKFNLVSGSSGAVQVVSGATGWQHLTPVPTPGGGGGVVCNNCLTPVPGNGGVVIAPPNPGFLVVYIDNQSIGKDVYFDHLEIEHYTSEVVDEEHYYPYGLTVNLNQNTNVTASPYKLTTKELEPKFDLNSYDFGARQQDMDGGRWLSPDPLAENYYSISPYAYCANNPVRYVDLDGMKIDPASQKEWDRQKQNVTSERGRLQGKIDNLNAKAAEKGWDANTLAKKIGDMGDRIKSLDGSLKALGTLEASSQVYSLKTIGATDDGGTTYDPKTGNIVIAYGNTSNFVHETTHADQFENGDIAFSRTTGNSLGQDVGDEVSAYKAQYAYDPSSVFRLNSSNGQATSLGAITIQWLQGLTNPGGQQPYSIGGGARTGLVPININSSRDQLI